MKSVQLYPRPSPIWIEVDSTRISDDFRKYSLVQAKNQEIFRLYEGMRILICFHISRMEMPEHIPEAFLSGQGECSIKVCKRIARILSTNLEETLQDLQKNYANRFASPSVTQEMECYLIDHPKTTLHALRKFSKFLSWSEGIILSLEKPDEL